MEEIGHESKTVMEKEAQGFWIDVPVDMIQLLEQEKLDVGASLHALCHVVVSHVPLLVALSPSRQAQIQCPCKTFQPKYGSIVPR